MSDGSSELAFPNRLNPAIYRYKAWWGEDDPIHRAAFNKYTVYGSNNFAIPVKLFDPRTGKENDYEMSAAVIFDNKASTWPSSNLELKVLSKMREEISGFDFNAANFLAEANQTVSLVLGTIKNLASLLRKLKRGDIPGALDALNRVSGGNGVPSGTGSRVRDYLDHKDLGSAWLALQYGWLPLLNDIKGAYDALQNLGSSRCDVTFKALATEKSHDTRGPSNHWWGLPGTSTRTDRLSYQLRVTERPDFARLLGISNPLTMAWELTPWSFAIDWFIPIGEYISNMGFFTGLRTNSEGWSFVSRNKAKAVVPKGIVWVGSSEYFTKSDFTGTFNSFRVLRRSANITVPLPEPNSIAKALSLGHLRNAAALIAVSIPSAKSSVTNTIWRKPRL